MATPIRKAALMASRMYLDEDDNKKGRTIKQCFAAAAQKFDIPYESVAAYVDACGLRALRNEDDESLADEMIDAVTPVLESAVGETKTASAWAGSPEWYEVDGELLERLDQVMGEIRKKIGRPYSD